VQGLDALRQALQSLEEVFRCPHCGRRRDVRCTDWRGHGIGVHGASYYTPTAREAVTPETHCICPGGPVWQELERTPLGEDLRLQESFWIWRQRGSKPDEVVVFLEGDLW